MANSECQELLTQFYREKDQVKKAFDCDVKKLIKLCKQTMGHRGTVWNMESATFHIWRMYAV